MAKIVDKNEDDEKKSFFNRQNSQYIIASLMVCFLVFGLGTQYSSYLTGTDSNVAVASTFIAVSAFEEQVSDQYITVSIDGAVGKAGIYTILANTSLRELVDYAGVSKNGTVSDFDFTISLSHGDMFYVKDSDNALESQVWMENYFTLNEVVVEEVTVDESELININTASIDELCTLPGIGETKAKAIITYRLEYNGFAFLEELLGVNGIGDTIYGNILPYVTL